MEEYLKGFDEFWKVYPRHVAKNSALKAYRRAFKVVAADVILAGAMRYAQERTGKADQFTKHPATWLNGGCWDDEPQRNYPTGVIGALDRLEQYLARQGGPVSRQDDNTGSADDLLGLPPR